MKNLRENYDMMFTSYPDVVNIRELKDMLNIGITLAYRLVKEKQIKSIKIGREYKIPKTNIISYLVNENNS